MKYLHIYNFLSDKEHNEIFDYAVNNESLFTQSGVLGDANHRCSKVLYDFPKDAFVNRLQKLLPFACDALDIIVNELGLIECQLTASNDKDYFKPHTDSNPEQVTKTRFLSYVYYFHRIPKRYLGGQLLLYNNQESKEYGNFKVVEPDNNSLVLFESCLLHEVSPVRCPNTAFENGRFTVNGWFNHA